MPDPLQVVIRGLTLGGEVVAGITNAQRSAPTPCADMDVEHLLSHLLGGLHWFAGLAARGDLDPLGTPDPDLSGRPLLDAYVEGAELIWRAWSPQMLDHTFEAPWGETSGYEIASFMAVEVLGHLWDLAVATGHFDFPQDDLAEEGLVIAHGLDEETLRSPGMLAPPVDLPPSAPAADRLAGFLGRDPRDPLAAGPAEPHPPAALGVLGSGGGDERPGGGARTGG
jgi:uncharacterized protein (TIGR03086 family)